MIRKFSLDGPLGLSLLALVVTAAAVLMSLPSLLSAALGGAGDVQPSQEVAKLISDHKTEIEKDQARFNGRSVFYKPPAKYKPPPTAPPKDTPKVVVQEAPKVKPPYQGPSLIAIAGDYVWFKPVLANTSTLMVRVGQEKEELKVLSINPPWSVRVAYKGNEYDVELFANKGDKLFGSQAMPKLSAKGLLPIPELVPTEAPVDEEVVAEGAPPGIGEGDESDPQVRGARGPGRLRARPQPGAGREAGKNTGEARKPPNPDEDEEEPKGETGAAKKREATADEEDEEEQDEQPAGGPSENEGDEGEEEGEEEDADGGPDEEGPSAEDPDEEEEEPPPVNPPADPPADPPRPTPQPPNPSASSMD